MLSGNVECGNSLYGNIASRFFLYILYYAERELFRFFANNHNNLWGDENRISKRQMSNMFEQKMAPKHFLEYFQ